MAKETLRWKMFWMVQDPSGTVYLGSASPFSKRGCLENWLRSTPKGRTWKWWYRHGYRVGKFSVSVKRRKA